MTSTFDPDPFGEPPERRASDATTVKTRRNSSSGASTRAGSVLTRVSSLRTDVSLAQVLGGETCSPISFKNFESFLAHKEFSVENLQFLIWFRSYRRRWLALPEQVRKRAPRPSTGKGDRWAPGPQRREWEKARGLSVDADSWGPDEKAGEMEREVPQTKFQVDLGEGGNVNVKRVGFQTCSWTKEGAHCTFDRHAVSGEDVKADVAHETHCRNSAHHHRPSAAGLDYTASCDPDDDGGMPFVDEARRCLATFLKVGAVKELNLEDKIRERVIRNLETSTHPDVWLPAYEATYNLVEGHSLNHFLSDAADNINLPKQLFWYAVGITDLLISLLLFLLFVILLPPAFKYRTVRLVSVIFASFGAMQTYSAARGFCTQVWGRGSRQLKPWELVSLEDDDEERRIGASAITLVVPPSSVTKLSPSEPVSPTNASFPPISAPAPPISYPSLASKKALAPWDEPDLGAILAPGESTPTLVGAKSNNPWDLDPPEDKVKRAPVFGPEVVIDDPRVIALHKRIVRDILIVGAGWALVWIALCLAVPSPRRS